MPDSKDVFLSYHDPDREAVRTVKNALEAVGITTFFDRQDLNPGLSWIEDLEDALRAVRVVAVFVGPELGKHQRQEVDFALIREAKEKSEGRPFAVIPVLLPGGKPQDSFLFKNTAIDLRPEFSEQDEIGRLVRAIRNVLPPEPRQGSVCPYRELRAFSEQDEALFFGRQALTKALLARVLAGKDVVAVIGASGSGKSSLVHAGLLPLLRRQRPPDRTWCAASFQPRSRPFHALASALVPLLDPATAKVDFTLKAGQLGEQMSADPGRLTDIVLEVLRSSGSTDRLLIVIDQFEELFTLAQESDRKTLPLAILNASKNAPVQFVLTVRADYYGQLINISRELSDRIESNIVNVGPMTPEELRESIVKPAELAGRSFEPGLADRIVSDLAGEPGQLPLMQSALTELWVNSGPLTHAVYNGLGGVANAISRKAEAVLRDFSAADQGRVRQIFSRLVHVTASGQGGEDVRGRPTIKELGPQARPLIDRLANERLLITTADKDGQKLDVEYVEVAHEALIRQWPRLCTWLKEDRNFLLWRQRLRQSLSQWQHAKRDEGALLRGPLLEEAQRWQTAKPEDLGPDELEFIKEGAALQSRLSHSERQRQRRGVRIIAAAVLAGLVISAVAVWQWRRATDQLKLSQAQALLSQARYYLDNDLSKLDLAVLFGVESLRRAPTAMADALVRESLLLLPRISHPVTTDCDLAREVFAFAPGGKYLTCMDARGSVLIVSTATGKVAAPSIPLAASLHVSAMALSPDGDLLLLGFASNGGFKLLKTADSSVIVSGGAGFDVTAVAFDSEGRNWAVAISNDQGSDILRATATAIARPISGARQLGRVYALAWGGDALAASHAGASRVNMEVTVLANGRLTPIAGGATLGTIALAKDGVFAAVCSENTVAYRGTNEQGAPKQLVHSMRTHAAALSPDGAYMASGSEDGSAHVMNTRTGMRVAVAPVGSSVEAAVFSSENTLAVLSRDGKVRTIDLAARGAFESLRSSTGRIVDISPGGRYFATWNASGDAHELIINDRVGKRLWALTISGDGFLPNSAFGFSQDEKFFTVAHPQDGVSIYDASNGSVLHHYAAATAPSSVQAVSGDATTVAWASGSTIRIWQLKAATPGARPRDLPSPAQGIAEITALALNADGTLLAASSASNPGVFIFNTKTNAWTNPIGSSGPVAKAVFSSDGATLLTLTGQRLMAFRMPDGAQAWPVESSTEVHGAAHASFNASSSEIALMGEDVSNFKIVLELFDARSGQPLTSAQYPANDKLDGLRRAIAFDAEVVLTADTISISRIPRTREALAKAACSILSRNITEEEWKTVEAPPSKTCAELP